MKQKINENTSAFTCPVMWDFNFNFSTFKSKVF